MSGKILVTDSLFIFDEHVKKLEAAGYEVERLDKPDATEEELCAAIKGKIGYVLGGIEKVTENVIDAADSLKVISATAIGYEFFIPAYEYATSKGIAITNEPFGPTQQVAEWAVGAALMMNRDFLGLGRTGDKKFETTKGLFGQKIGFIGFGRIGQRVASIVEKFEPASLTYFSPNERPEDAKKLGIKFDTMENVLSDSDVIFLCLGDRAGHDFISEDQLQNVKDGSLLVSIMHDGIIDKGALLTHLKSGRIRAISDYKMDSRFDDLPLGTWFCFNGSNAFNSEQGLKVMSDMAVDSLLNVLKTGDDQYLVNPGYKQ